MNLEIPSCKSALCREEAECEKGIFPILQSHKRATAQYPYALWLDRSPSYAPCYGAPPTFAQKMVSLGNAVKLHGNSFGIISPIFSFPFYISVL